MIQVAIIEDDQDIRETLSLLIDGTPGFVCSQSYNDCESALADLPKDLPDVVLMDINLPGMSGIEGTRYLKNRFPDLDILMLTIQVDDDSVFESICSGATGYLLKDTSPDALISAIEEVKQGGAPMSTQVARKVVLSFKRTEENPLTTREQEILKKLCDGQNYKAIAEELFVSGHTVRSHIKNIYRKLHVTSRAEAVKKAFKDKLI
jgi:DNA-binding NarL/FixJ family response regulator